MTGSRKHKWITKTVTGYTKAVLLEEDLLRSKGELLFHRDTESDCSPHTKESYVSICLLLSLSKIKQSYLK